MFSTYTKNLLLSHTETHLDCFPEVPIIACLHPLYAFRNAVKSSAAGAVLFCNASQQTWPNKQIEENSASHRTSHEVLNLPEAFLSLTSTKPFIFANRKHLWMALAYDLWERTALNCVPWLLAASLWCSLYCVMAAMFSLQAPDSYKDNWPPVLGSSFHILFI